MSPSGSWEVPPRDRVTVSIRGLASVLAARATHHHSPVPDRTAPMPLAPSSRLGRSRCRDRRTSPST